nr:MAG TPA: hypothetical protein [Bacteriophage sp.]
MPGYRFNSVKTSPALILSAFTQSAASSTRTKTEMVEVASVCKMFVPVLLKVGESYTPLAFFSTLVIFYMFILVNLRYTYFVGMSRSPSTK